MMLGFDTEEKKHPFSTRRALLDGIEKNVFDNCWGGSPRDTPAFGKFGDCYDMLLGAVGRRIIDMGVDGWSWLAWRGNVPDLPALGGEI